MVCGAPAFVPAAVVLTHGCKAPAKVGRAPVEPCQRILGNDRGSAGKIADIYFFFMQRRPAEETCSYTCVHGPVSNLFVEAGEDILESAAGSEATSVPPSLPPSSPSAASVEGPRPCSWRGSGASLCSEEP